MTAQKVATFLMFDGRAEEAINFYTSLFADSSIARVEHSGADGPGMSGAVAQAAFTLKGTVFMAIDSPVKHHFGFTPSMSLFVHCDSIEELDNAYHKLTEGGEVLMPPGEYPFSKRYCWVNDRFGVSWQLSYVGQL